MKKVSGCLDEVFYDFHRNYHPELTIYPRMVLLYIILLLLLSIFSFSFWLSNLLLYPPRQPLARNPKDYNLAFEDVSFSSTDHLELKGWWIPADGQAPAVILLHPLFGNRHGLIPRSGLWPAIFREELDLLKVAQAFHQAGWSVLMFDFRSHGESPRGLCAGGLTEDQDVTGAVDFTFKRQSAGLPKGETPQVGLVGFGSGAAASIAAIGRTKGKAEKMMVFTGDSEGGAGWTEVLPPNNKLLCFLIAVRPAPLDLLLRGFLKEIASLLGPLLVPIVDWLCQLRGGYPLGGARLLKAAGEVHLPVLFIQSPKEPKAMHDSVQVLYEALPDAKCIESEAIPQVLLDFASARIRK